VSFPNTTEWTPTTSTEKGDVTFYGVAPAPPTVTAVSPDEGLTGQTGQVITVTGTNFTDVTGVTVDGEDCVSFTVNSDMEITCILPTFTTPGAKSVQVTTQYGGTNAENLLYTVLEASEPEPEPTPTPPNPDIPPGFVPDVPNTGRR
jgi:hypothetical protein